MGVKELNWICSNITTDSAHRFVSDIQINTWNNKLDNITVTDWNNATTSGFYTSGGGR